MRTGPNDVRLARHRRGALLALTATGLAMPLVAALVPALEPYLAPPRLPLFVLLGGATAGAAAALVGARRDPSWSSADDVAWVVGLGALSVLAGACGAPLGVGFVLYAAAMLALAARDPSPALVFLACATTALVPIVHTAVAGTLPALVPSLVATTSVALAFSRMLGQTRQLSRALAERDAAERERAASPRPSTSARSGGRAAAERERDRAGAGADAQEQGWDALVERVRSSVTLMAENAGVEASVQAELSGLAPPSTKIRTHLLRIAQEATTQALRLAEPRSIVVRLRRGDGGIVFELQDDGSASESIRQRRSIATLRGRAAALGGTAELRRADNGWVTRVRLPCEQLN